MELSVTTPGPNWIPLIARQPECSARFSVISNGAKKNRMRIRLSPAAAELMGLEPGVPVQLYRHTTEPTVLFWPAAQGIAFREDRGVLVGMFPTDLAPHHAVDVEIRRAGGEDGSEALGLGLAELPASFFAERGRGAEPRQKPPQRPSEARSGGQNVRPEVVVTGNVVGRQESRPRPMLVPNDKAAGKEDPHVSAAIAYLRENGDDVTELGTFDGFKVNGNTCRGADLIRRARFKGMAA